MLFVWALENNDTDLLTTSEVVFMIYALGFSLEKVATMQEHGLHVYVNGTWVRSLPLFEQYSPGNLLSSRMGLTSHSVSRSRSHFDELTAC